MPDMPDSIADIAKTLIANAQRNSEPTFPTDYFTGKPVMLVPEGWEIRPVKDWEPLTPVRVSSKVILDDLDSFCRYVNQFKCGYTILFAQTQGSGRLEAIIDYHAAPVVGLSRGAAAWCSHRVIYAPIASEQFTAWSTRDKVAMTQLEFSAFLENHLPSVVSPTGADLLEIINKFEIDGVLNFSRAQRLQDGSVAFSFLNETKARSGEVAIPARLGISVPLFVNGAQVLLSARLRYRLSTGGELKLWFELENVVAATRASLLAMVEKAKTIVGIDALIGAAPAV